MKRQLTKIISSIMMVVFLAGILPKQYLHDLLFSHRDTVHPSVKKGELVISGRHTHCSFVAFAFGPFVSSQRIALTFPALLTHVSCFAAHYDCHYYCPRRTLSLRGPPAAC